MQNLKRKDTNNVLAFRRKRRAVRDELTSSQQQGEYNDAETDSSQSPVSTNMSASPRGSVDGTAWHGTYTDSMDSSADDIDGLEMIPEESPTAASTSGGGPHAALSSEISPYKFCGRNFQKECVTKQQEIFKNAIKRVRDIFESTEDKIKNLQYEMVHKIAHHHNRASSQESDEHVRRRHEQKTSCARSSGRHVEMLAKKGEKNRDLRSPRRMQNPHSERRSNRNAADRDIMVCATRKRKGPMQNSDSSEVTERSISPRETNSNRGREALVVCKHCGATCTKDRFPKHREICQRGRSRNFQPTKERMKSVEYERVHKIAFKRSRAISEDSGDSVRSKHEQTTSYFRSSVHVQKYVTKREKIIDLRSPRRLQNPHYERRSNENAADRDINVWATRKRKEQMEDSDSSEVTEGSTSPRGTNSNRGRGVLVVCKHCGATCTKDRFQKHREICRRECSKERMKSGEYEKDDKNPFKRSRAISKDSGEDVRRNHEQNTSCYRPSRHVQNHVFLGERNTDLRSTPRMPSSYSEHREIATARNIMIWAARKQQSTVYSTVYIKCAHCDRCYNRYDTTSHDEVCAGQKLIAPFSEPEVPQLPTTDYQLQLCAKQDRKKPIGKRRHTI